MSAKPVSDEPQDTVPDKPLRSDARRNREVLLATARDVFSAGDLDIHMKDIAKRAGVGVGTLYRHFDTREALIEAVYRQEVETLCEGAPKLLETLPADQALAAFLHRLVGYAVENKGLGTVLTGMMASDSPAFVQGQQQLSGAVTLLLNAGVSEKSLRADIEPETVLMMIGGICATYNQPGWEDQAQAMVALLLDGLKFGVGRI